MSDMVLEVSGLVKEFDVRSTKGLRTNKQKVQAVSGVSFGIGAGETLGLVGESGSGKTTVGRCVLQLLEPTAGSVKFKGEELVGIDRSRMRELRREMQIVFQDPFASLDPRITVGSSISEPLVINKVPGDREEAVRDLLMMVGLAPDHARRFPHEFSGGQRQRIGIARALSLRPSMLVLDEPVSALDVSIQAGVVNLLQDLQDELGLSYLFIAHDLSVVRHISDRIAVMYLGKVVEIAESEEMHAAPAHPYTAALLAAVPEPDPARERSKERAVLEGEVPSPINPPSGCRFRTRCPRAEMKCSEEEPVLREVVPGRSVACHFPNEVPVTVGRAPS